MIQFRISEVPRLAATDLASSCTQTDYFLAESLSPLSEGLSPLVQDFEHRIES